MSGDVINDGVNAGVHAGLAFFTTLIGEGAVGLLSNPTLALTAAGISAGFYFFTYLAARRGLGRFRG